MSRLKRIAEMSWRQRLAKLFAKVNHYASPRLNLRRLAFQLDKWSLAGNEGIYQERAEYGPVNLHTKLARVAQGGPFEPRDVTLVNKLAARLAGKPANVLEVGSGTAMFSTMLLGLSPETKIVASEFDNETREWSMKNRAHPNITFCRKGFSDFQPNEFDLVVAIEVIEHIDDYDAFLRPFSRMAPKAIVTTPNKFRSSFDSEINTPIFDQHVREWSAGEFYWVLRAVWDQVEIHTIPNMSAQMKRLAVDENFQPISKITGVHCREHSLVAICQQPRWSK